MSATATSTMTTPQTAGPLGITFSTPRSDDADGDYHYGPFNGSFSLPVTPLASTNDERPIPVPLRRNFNSQPSHNKVVLQSLPLAPLLKKNAANQPRALPTPSMPTFPVILSQIRSWTYLQWQEHPRCPRHSLHPHYLFPIHNHSRRIYQ